MRLGRKGFRQLLQKMVIELLEMLVGWKVPRELGHAIVDAPQFGTTLRSKHGFGVQPSPVTVLMHLFTEAQARDYRAVVEIILPLKAVYAVQHFKTLL